MSAESTRDALLALSDLHLGALTRYAGILHPGPATAQILLDETRPLELEEGALASVVDRLAPCDWPTDRRPNVATLEVTGAKMRRVLAPACPHSEAVGPCWACGETCHHYTAKEQDAD